MQTGQRVAAAGMVISGALAVIKITAGLAGNSTAVVSDGLESAADVIASGFVLFGLTLAAKPADAEHPYGHGRVETLTGLLIGLVLTLGGGLISWNAIRGVGKPHEAIAAFVVWPLLLSLFAKMGLAGVKFHFGRKLKSDALTADAWNDATDTVSALAALTAVGLTLWDPSRFAEADRYGGFAVGLIVIGAGLRVVRDTTYQLIDTMPDPKLIARIREAAFAVPEVRGVEKCYARKTGFKYHVDLHLEVDPEMTVRRSHQLAHEVQLNILARLDFVADVLVHVEPAPVGRRNIHAGGAPNKADDPKPSSIPPPILKSAMNDSLLRAWWSHRQGLDGSLMGKPAADVLAATGWARSVAGIGPYLTLFSRAGIGREAADAAVAATSICELPSARGCTYVLPARDFAVGLTVGQPFRAAEMNTARKVGVTDQEIDKLCDAILAVLKKQSLDPAEIRDLVGPAARSLGEAGKKKGLTTTLPVALGRLQAEGEIRRIPVNGRLDQQRYQYVRWTPNPRAKCKLSYEQCVSELAARYFSWAGPATLAEFQWFSGLSQTACRAAIESLHLVPLQADSPRLLHPADRDALGHFQPPKEPHYTLVSSLDGISLLRRDLKSLLDPADLERSVPVEKGERALSGLADLESHAILDRGRVAGIWEFDPAAEKIVWISFVKPNAALKEAITRTEAYVREQVGDARSFSLDSPKSREPKLKALRAAMR